MPFCVSIKDYVDIGLDKNMKMHHISWKNEESNNLLYCNLHQVGEVDLSSGKHSKRTFSSSIKKKLITSDLIFTSNFGVVIVGLLTTNEVLVCDHNLKFINLLEIPSSFFMNSLERKGRVHEAIGKIQTFSWLHLRSKETKKLEERDLAVRPFKPVIFPSDDLSMIMIIPNYFQVYVWYRVSFATSNTLRKLTGTWNMFEASEGICLPDARDKRVSVHVAYFSRSLELLGRVGFCFLLSNVLVVTSLVLHKELDDKSCFRKTPSSKWKQKKFNLRQEELVSVPNKRGALIIRSHWVSCLRWNPGCVFVIGVLKSGYIFLASRFGPLLTITCHGLGSNSIIGKFIQIFPGLNVSRKQLSESSNDNSGSSMPSDVITPKFSLSSHPSKDLLVISSGFHICKLSFPSDAKSEEGALRLLVKETHRLNYGLKEICQHHDYDFIHCSHWRLFSRSLHDVSVPSSDGKRVEGTIRLWHPTVIEPSDDFPLTELETKMKGTSELVEALWNFVSSYSEFNHRWRRLMKKAVKVSIQIFSTVLFTSSPHDNEEHQARLTHCLRLLHRIAENVVCLFPSPFLVLRPLLMFVRKFLHIVVRSVQGTSVERRLICLLILTQTLNLFRDQISCGIQIWSMESPDLMSPESKECYSILNSVMDLRLKSHWLCLYRLWTSLCKDRDVKSFSKLNRTRVLAANIIGEKAEFCSFQRFKRVRGAPRKFFVGKVEEAVRETKTEIETMVKKMFHRRHLQKLVFFLFHIYVVESEWFGMTKFVQWFCDLIKTISEAEGEKKKCFQKRLILMRKIFKQLVGKVGILMTQKMLGVSKDLSGYTIPGTNSQEEPSSKDSRPLPFKAEEEYSVINEVETAHCLMMGGNYEALFKLGYSLGDIRLCFFSMVAASEIESDFNPSTVDDFLLSIMAPPSVVSKSCQSNQEDLPSPNGTLLFSAKASLKEHRGMEDALYFSVLFKGRSKLLQCLLQRCLKEMEAVIGLLPLIVPLSFPLPFPPLFSTPMELEEQFGEEEDQAMLKCEMDARRKLSWKLRYFCLVCSAAGIGGYLLRTTLSDVEVSSTLMGEVKEIFKGLNICFKGPNPTDDEEWVEVKQIWNSFLKILFSFHSRDNLSLALRKWNHSRFQKAPYKTIQNRSFEVAEEAKNIFFSSFDASCESFSILVAALWDSPRVIAATHLLASVTPHLSPIPSLAQDRLTELLDEWGKVHVEQEEGERMSLRTLYEIEVERTKKKVSKASTISLSLSETRVDFLCIFASITFVKFEQDFCVKEKPYPYLQQFRKDILAFEFRGLHPREVLSEFVHQMLDESQTDAKHHKVKGRVKEVQNDRVSDVPKRKKGLFRSLDLWRPPSSLAFIVYNEDCSNKSRYRSYSGSRRKRDKQERISRSQSAIMRRETFNVVPRIKLERDERSKIILEPNFVSNSYRSILGSNCDTSSLSNSFLYLVLWILRRDRIFFKFSDSEKNIMSSDDLKLAVLWLAANQSLKSRKKDIVEKPRTDAIAQSEDIAGIEGSSSFLPGDHPEAQTRKKRKKQFPFSSNLRNRLNDFNLKKEDSSDISLQNNLTNTEANLYQPPFSNDHTNIFHCQSSTSKTNLPRALSFTEQTLELLSPTTDSGKNYGLDQCVSNQTSSLLEKSHSVDSDSERKSDLSLDNNSWQPFVVRHICSDTESTQNFGRESTSSFYTKVEQEPVTTEGENTLVNITLPDSFQDSFLGDPIVTKRTDRGILQHNRFANSEIPPCPPMALRPLPLKEPSCNVIFRPKPFNISEVLHPICSSESNRTTEWVLKKVPPHLLDPKSPLPKPKSPFRILKVPSVTEKVQNSCPVVPSNKQSLNLIKNPSLLFNSQKVPQTFDDVSPSGYIAKPLILLKVPLRTMKSTREELEMIDQLAPSDEPHEMADCVIDKAHMTIEKRKESNKVEVGTKSNLLLKSTFASKAKRKRTQLVAERKEFQIEEKTNLKNNEDRKNPKIKARHVLNDSKANENDLYRKADDTRPQYSNTDLMNHSNYSHNLKENTSVDISGKSFYNSAAVSNYQSRNVTQQPVLSETISPSNRMEILENFLQSRFNENDIENKRSSLSTVPSQNTYFQQAKLIQTETTDKISKDISSSPDEQAILPQEPFPKEETVKTKTNNPYDPTDILSSQNFGKTKEKVVLRNQQMQTNFEATKDERWTQTSLDVDRHEKMLDISVQTSFVKSHHLRPIEEPHVLPVDVSVLVQPNASSIFRESNEEFPEWEADIPQDIVNQSLEMLGKDLENSIQNSLNFDEGFNLEDTKNRSLLLGTDRGLASQEALIFGPKDLKVQSSQTETLKIPKNVNLSFSEVVSTICPPSNHQNLIIDDKDESTPFCDPSRSKGYLKGEKEISREHENGLDVLETVEDVSEKILNYPLSVKEHVNLEHLKNTQLSMGEKNNSMQVLDDSTKVPSPTSFHFISGENTSENVPEEHVLQLPLQMTLNDALDHFMKGSIRLEDILASSFPEIMRNERRSSPRSQFKTLNIVGQDVHKIKHEIFSMKSLLQKVQTIHSSWTIKSQEQIKNLCEILGRLESTDSAHVQFPSTENRQDVLEFLNLVSPVNLTSEVVSRILQFVESDFDHGSLKHVEMATSGTGTGDFSETIHNSSERSYSSENSDGVEGTFVHGENQTSPDFKLPLSCFGSYSDLSILPSSSTNPKDERRKAVRAWMRQKHLQKKSKRKDTSKEVLCEEGSPTSRSFSGKQIRETLQTMEMRRENLMEENRLQREQEIESILLNHSRERDSVTHLFGTKKRPNSSLDRTFVVNKKRGSQPIKDVNQKMQTCSSIRNLTRTIIKPRMNIASGNKEKGKDKLKSHNLPSKFGLVKHEMVQLRSVLTSNRKQSFSTPTSVIQPPENKSYEPNSPPKRVSRSLELIVEVSTPSESSSLNSSSITDSSWSLPEDIQRLLE